MTAEIVSAVAARNKLGESPFWCPREQVLLWVDIEQKSLQRFEPHTKAVQSWRLPERIGSFALRERGGAVLALASGFAFFDFATGAVERLAAPEKNNVRNRFNDGKCDRSGRFWAGTMDDRLAEHTGALYRLDSELACQRMEAGIGIPNSIAWSPDDRVFYLADTMDRAIYAYDFDRATGAIANRRVFCTMQDQPGAPDGSTVDAEGFLWNAQWDGWRVVRYDPEGRIERTIELPVQKPTSCMFGGPDLSTLYVTSAIWDLKGPALAAQPWAGNVLAIDVGVRGLPEPRFAG